MRFLFFPSSSHLVIFTRQGFFSCVRAILGYIILGYIVPRLFLDTRIIAKSCAKLLAACTLGTAVGDPRHGDHGCLRSASPAAMGIHPGCDRLFPAAGQMRPNCCFTPDGNQVGNAGSAAAAGSGSAAVPTGLIRLPRLHLQMVSRKLRKRQQAFICTLMSVSHYDLTLLGWRSQAVPSWSEKTVLANALKS